MNEEKKEFVKPKTFKDPQQLLDLWQDYKSHVDKNPDLEEVVSAGEVITKRNQKPYLRQGFESFIYDKLGKHIHQYLDNDGGNYGEYLGVVTHIRNEWQTNQISGTLTGKFKAPNLVARLNGLVDKKDVTTDGDKINTTPIINVIAPKE